MEDKLTRLRSAIQSAQQNELHATYGGKRYQLQRGIFGHPDTYVFISLDDVKQPGMYFFEPETWASGISVHSLRDNTLKQFGIDILQLDWK